MSGSSLCMVVCYESGMALRFAAVVVNITIIIAGRELLPFRSFV